MWFAETFTEAMYKIETFQYDCIILDIMLPDGNGLKILEELKSQNKQDSVIIVSAKMLWMIKSKGLQLGADDYLTKTVSSARIDGKNLFYYS